MNRRFRRAGGNRAVPWRDGFPRGSPHTIRRCSQRRGRCRTRRRENRTCGGARCRPAQSARGRPRDRKSVVEGKRVSVRVNPGGRGIIKKKINKKLKQDDTKK